MQADERECCPTLELQQYVNEHFMEEMRTGLVFLPKFSHHAQDKLAEAKAKMGGNAVTFVGIHNRRTDYISYMEGMFGIRRNPFDKSYFRAAMEYFREELDDDDSKTAFLYVSDDMDWGRKNVRNRHKDLFFAGRKTYTGTFNVCCSNE